MRALTASRLVALALVAACARSVAPPEPPPVHPAASRAPSVLEPGALHDPATTPPARLPVARPTTPSPVLAPVRVSVVRVTAAEGEDGTGRTVPATDPVAIDLDTPGGWPGRALATTLHVGALHFHTPGYPSATAMRFIAADARALPLDAPVSLQYGPDPDHRRVVAPSLAAPR